MNRVVLEVLACLFLGLGVVSAGSSSADYVDLTNIPNIPPTSGFDTYAGYLSVNKDNTQQQYYIYVESQNNPTTDPLIVWLGGGPCCSALYGLFYENGPWVFDAGDIALHVNEHAWNQNANVLYLEGPAGTGFSINTDTTAIPPNDESTASANIEALTVFLTEKHPELATADIYLAGQSYAGMAIPWLGFFLVTFNNFAPFKLNLKGVMIGNGVTVPHLVDPVSSVEYLYQHALVDQLAYDNYKSQCFDDPYTSACQTLLDTNMQSLAALNPYNIYGECYNSTSPSADSSSALYSWRDGMKDLGRDESSCLDVQGIDMLLNSVDVRQGFHTYNNVTTWQMCNEECSEAFQTDYVLGSYWVYPFFLTGGIKVLVYSGDLDAIVPITDTMTWLTDLQKELKLKTEQPWSPWYMNGTIPDEPQAVGNHWQLTNLTYVSIKGAGGNVPQDKRPESLEMVNNFIYDLPFRTKPSP